MAEKSNKINSKKTILVTLGLALSFAYLRHYEKSPVVQLPCGNVQGFVSKSRSGHPFYSFLGVPFATPPVGHLRFESPQPVKKWNGTLSATSYQNECKGYDFILTGRKQGDEDCLYLNIFTSEVLQQGDPVEKAKKKVIVYIHGGAFLLGSAKIYQPRFLMDHEDVVLVTVQYRLGIFGFLTSHDATIKGNMGLKDVVESLRWVQKNIAYFMGDPNDVTVMGESAGGGATSMLTLSPMAKGLFHKAVTWSCDAISDLWQMNRNYEGHFEVIATGMNCPVDSKEAAAICLKAKSADELLTWSMKLDTIETYGNPYGFAPARENHNESDAFLTEFPIEMLKRGQIHNPVPLLYGVNENEGLIMVAKILHETNLVENLDDDDFWAEHMPRVIQFNSTSNPNAALKLKDHYFGNRTIDLTVNDDIQTLSALINDKIFYRKFVETARLQSKVSPVFLFHYSYKSYFSTFDFLRAGHPSSMFPMELLSTYATIRNFFQKIIFWEPNYHFGTSHADSLLLIFGVHPFTEFVLKFYDFDMSSRLIQTIVDFVHLEHPHEFQYQGIAWPPVESNDSSPLPVMDINLKGRLLEDPFKERLKFVVSLNLPHE